MGKWVHYNHWVDGEHKIKEYDTRKEAYTGMVEFIGHDEYKAGPNGLRSDDGDFSFIRYEE